MITATADLFTYPHADAICITTNGATVRTSGGRHAVYRGVMGRGVAWQAKQRWPEIETQLGQSIRQHGNTVAILRQPESIGAPFVVSFPVKHHWHEPADLQLIAQSAEALVKLATLLLWRVVVLPRPGCGNGGLDWYEVEWRIKPLLDDRFVVVTV